MELPPQNPAISAYTPFLDKLIGNGSKPSKPQYLGEHNTNQSSS